MISCIIFIAVALISFYLIGATKIKSEYIFMLMFLAFVVLGSNSPVKTALFAAVSFIAFYLIGKLNINSFIKASYPIYIATLILLAAALVLPGYNGLHRYVFIGSTVIYPADLVVFSLLPICTIINKMEYFSANKLIPIIALAGLELCLVILQPNVQPAIIMFALFLILIHKAKIDNRLNAPWTGIAFIDAGCVIGLALPIFYTPARAQIISIIENVLYGGANDPLGAGYQLHFVDSIMNRIKFIGPCDLSGIDTGLELLTNMPLLSFATKFGWISVILLAVAATMLITSIYLMSSKINNSFARYVCFGIATYFAVGSVFHLVAEFVLGYNSDHFVFMGKSSGMLIDSVLVAIAFALFRKRNQIKVGRQPDIDYDMTTAMLDKYEKIFTDKFENKALPENEKAEIKVCLETIKADKEDWNNGNKSIHEIKFDYETPQENIDSSNAGPDKYPIEKGTVFISSNHFDDKYAQYLAKKIRQKGATVWHYTQNNDADKYAETITKKIYTSQVFIVILSHSSKKSNHVKSEVRIAFDNAYKGTTILPIKIDDVMVNSDPSFNYYLGGYPIIDASNPPPVKKQLDKFINNVKQHL